MDSLILHIIKDKLKEPIDNIGLFKGQAGICLALFESSSKDKSLNETAEQLLDNICSKIDKIEDISFSNGISGIGWVICRLHAKGFIEGDIDEILFDIDASIYRYVYDPTIQFQDVSLANGTLGFLLYTIERIKNSGLKCDTMQIRLLKELARTLINRLYVTLPQSLSRIGQDVYTTILWDIPIAFLLFKQIIDLDIYPTKIENMLKGWSVYLTNRIPHYEINKLAFLTTLSRLNQSVNDNQWTAIIHNRLQLIDFDRIESEIDCRLRDVNEGWFFFAIVLNEALTTTHPLHPSYKLMENTLQQIVEKHFPSFLNDLRDSNGKDFKISLIDGLSGILLTINHLRINNRTNITHKNNSLSW